MAFVQRWNWCVATCAGFGYAPVMPGTAGALWGVAIYAVIAASCAGWAERYFQEEDSSRFVTDEVAGFLVTVLLFRTPHISTTVLWAFPVTRVLDIIKVPPARWLERLPRGWGVLADDVVDSLYAAALLHALQALSPQWFA